LSLEIAHALNECHHVILLGLEYVLPM
jgi:hypothetical protein